MAATISMAVPISPGGWVSLVDFSALWSGLMWVWVPSLISRFLFRRWYSSPVGYTKSLGLPLDHHDEWYYTWVCEVMCKSSAHLIRIQPTYLCNFLFHFFYVCNICFMQRLPSRAYWKLWKPRSKLSICWWWISLWWDNTRKGDQRGLSIFN